MMKKTSQQNDVQLPEAPTDSVSSLRCSADGALLAATAWDGTVSDDRGCVWRVED